MSATTAVQPFITPDALRDHWQGHRRLTRRVMEKFPEHKLFSFSVGGMRPFGDLANETIGMAAPTIEGLITDKWSQFAEAKATSREELLHHRGQGYVYLRALGIEPPPFYER